MATMHTHDKQPAASAPRDLSHLHALEEGLSRKRDALAAARTDRERELRQVWVDQALRELQAERRFLGLPTDVQQLEYSDEELLELLQA